MSTILNELVKIREKLDSDGTYSGSTAGVPETVTQIRELVENGAGSGGSKTFEIGETPDDEFGFIVKATPEEMEVGALAVVEDAFLSKAYMCMNKGRDFLTNKPTAVFISTYGDNEIRTFKCAYNETKGGYVYGDNEGGNQPLH